MLSLEMVRIVELSVLNDEITTPRCPEKACMHSPVDTRHLRHRISADPVNNSVAALLNDTQHTPEACPFIIAMHPPDSASQTRPDISSDPEATSHPSEENSQSLTSLLCPFRTLHFLVWTSQRRQVQSAEQDNTMLP